MTVSSLHIVFLMQKFLCNGYMPLSSSEKKYMKVSMRYCDRAENNLIFFHAEVFEVFIIPVLKTLLLKFIVVLPETF